MVPDIANQLAQSKDKCLSLLTMESHLKSQPEKYLLGQPLHVPFPPQGSVHSSAYAPLSTHRNAYLWKHMVYMCLYICMRLLNMLFLFMYICHVLLAPAETYQRKQGCSFSRVTQIFGSSKLSNTPKRTADLKKPIPHTKHLCVPWQTCQPVFFGDWFNALFMLLE